jgi:hypothetical protein
MQTSMDGTFPQPVPHDDDGGDVGRARRRIDHVKVLAIRLARDAGECGVRLNHEAYLFTRFHNSISRSYTLSKTESAPYFEHGAYHKYTYTGTAQPPPTDIILRGYQVIADAMQRNLELQTRALGFHAAMLRKNGRFARAKDLTFANEDYNHQLLVLEDLDVNIARLRNDTEEAIRVADPPTPRIYDGMAMGT